MANYQFNSQGLLKGGAGAWCLTILIVVSLVEKKIVNAVIKDFQLLPLFIFQWAPLHLPLGQSYLDSNIMIKFKNENTIGKRKI